MGNSTRIPTITDVADLAGVSSATVSYVLSGRRSISDRISQSTRQRVLQAVESLGYAPNQAARSLRRQRTERVCLITNRTFIPYNEILIQQLDSAAAAHGYLCVILVGGSAERNRRAFDQLRQGLADGAYIRSSLLDADELQKLVDTGLALVVEGNVRSVPGADFVHLPHERASAEAVRYLIARGHSRIGFLGFGPLDPPSPRFAAYLQVLSEHGITADPGCCVVHEEGVRIDAYSCAAHLLNQPHRPTAIFADTDLAAMAAIGAARDIGLRIPHDIAIIGLGNLPEGMLTRPALTTIGPARIDFGPGVDLLFDRLAGRAPVEGSTWEMPWQLFERGSV